MDSDESEHSESEFYYNDDGIDKENRGEKSSENSFTIDEVQSFISAQRPENTVNKTKYDINVWKRFLSDRNERRQIEDIPASELNMLVCRFFMEIRKKDGEAYEPTSLTSFHRSLQRYLNDKQSTINILKDKEFIKSREVLSSKKKQLVEVNAKGNRPQAARELTEEEEDLLFSSGEFGDQNPEALQRTVWWLLSISLSWKKMQ